MSNGERIFPPAHTPGGALIPHTPSQREMDNCGYAAQDGVDCPRKKGERSLVTGGPAPLIDCASCRHRKLVVD